MTFASAATTRLPWIAVAIEGSRRHATQVGFGAACHPDESEPTRAALPSQGDVSTSVETYLLAIKLQEFAGKNCC